MIFFEKSKIVSSYNINLRVSSKLTTSQFQKSSMIDLSAFNPKSKKYKKNELRSIADFSSDKFEQATSSVYSAMKKELEALADKESVLQDEISNYSENNGGIPTSEDIEIIDKIMAITSDTYWTTEHLTAISEMKIIYLFKSLEITIKSLIKAAYPNINTKDFFKWDNIIAYFKSIGIKLSILDGYQDANDLRKVNNCLKHTNTITDEIKKISEFTYSNEFDFNNIDSFYERIKLKVKNFPKLIEQEIVKDLFIFDDERIENIADDFGKRMNPATMSQLIEKLKVAKTS